MPDLYVRNVPESLYERIRERAEKQNRSLSAEVIALLGEALEVTAVDQAELLAGIRRRRLSKPTVSGTPDSTTLLRNQRDGRR